MISSNYDNNILLINTTNSYSILRASDFNTLLRENLYKDFTILKMKLFGYSNILFLTTKEEPNILQTY